MRRKLVIFMMTFSLMLSTILFTDAEHQTVSAANQYVDMGQTINQLMKDSRMIGVNSSITVRKASTGEIIYEYNGDKGITPASTLKLLTSAAALDTLGEEFRFSTDMMSNGTIINGVLQGDLYLRGKGDPTLLKRDLDNFATQLKTLGIKTISGNLIGDDTWFDTIRLSPGIHKNDESYYYAAQVSALTLSPNEDYDAGSVIVETKPTMRGQAGKVTLTPATTIVRVVNRSKTVAKGNKNTLNIERQHGSNIVMITGNVPIGSAGKKEWIAVSNPTAYALDVFKKSLSEKGIHFAKASKLVRGKTPETARVLGTKKSMPLKDLMKPFMKLSNNSHAEALAKTMGQVKYGQGSWTKGLQVMREYAESVGLETNRWQFEDASGMSHANAVTSSQMTELLYIVRSAPWYSTFLRSLPIAGANDRFVGGTLRNRLKTVDTKGKVLAKTGSLDHVSALAGYAMTKNGELLIFSVLTKDHKLSTVPVLDLIATAVANSSN